MPSQLPTHLIPPSKRGFVPDEPTRGTSGIYPNLWYFGIYIKIGD